LVSRAWALIAIDAALERLTGQIRPAGRPVTIRRTAGWRVAALATVIACL
jgi:hypothetical protein